MRKKQFEKVCKKRFERKKSNIFRGMALGLSTVLCLGMLAGCGGAGKQSGDSVRYATSNAGAAYANSESYSKKSYTDSAVAEYDNEALWSEGENYENPTADSVNKNMEQTSASKRKLIKNVNMNVETQEFDQLMSNLENRIKELGGYIQNMESYNGSKYGNSSYYRNSRRNASLTIRIPQQKLDEFVGSVSDLANVVNRSESVNDVTLQYVDMQSHKESLLVEQKRLLELLDRAENLEDIITLENRLTNVRYQIESMESSLRTFDDQVDYSTVYLKIDEVEIYTPVVVEEKNAWQRMSEGFMDSLVSVKDGFVEFFIWFIVNIPYLLIWAIVITVFVVFFRRVILKKGGKRKKARKALETKEQTNDMMQENANIKTSGEESANTDNKQ